MYPGARTLRMDVTSSLSDSPRLPWRGFFSFKINFLGHGIFNVDAVGGTEYRLHQ